MGKSVEIEEVNLYVENRKLQERVDELNGRLEEIQKEVIVFINMVVR